MTTRSEPSSTEGTTPEVRHAPGRRPGPLHRRLVREPVVGRAPTWGEAISAAVAVGALSGVLELGVLMTQMQGIHYVDWTTLMISRHAGWLIPATSAVLVVMAAIPMMAPMLALAAWRARRATGALEPGPAWGWAGAVLGFLLFLGPMLAIRGLHPIAPIAIAVGVGYRARRLIVRPTLGWKRQVHGAAVAGIALLGLLVATQWHVEASASGPAVIREGKPAPNLLWIVLDTLRADRMSLYGYHRPTTPRLDAWARRGITFETARSTAPWTLPSHISMFTGLWPSEHGACVDRAYHLDHPTIAEHLRDQGYATAGIVANVRMCNTSYGVGRGFDHYVDYPWRDEVTLEMALTSSAVGPMAIGLARRLGFHLIDFHPYDYHQPAATIAAEGRQWIESRAGDRRPYFLFLNFMDVHGPYLPTAEAPHRFYQGPPPSKDNARPEEGWKAAKALETANPAQREGRQKEVEAVARRLGDLYDDCLSGLDDQVGRLLETLRENGRLADTWVVITGDHGEHFGEHGHFGHGSSLYNEQTHVPLILIPPTARDDSHPDRFAYARGRRIAAPVSLRDLPLTMTGLLLPSDPSPFPGRNLARHWRSNTPLVPDAVLSQLDEPRLKGDDFRTSGILWMEAIVAEDHTMIEYSRRPTELFSLKDDPKQQHNLADHPDQTELRTRLHKRLDELCPRNRER